MADTLRTGAPAPVHEWSISTKVEASVPVFVQGSEYWTNKAVVAAGGMARQASSESVAVKTPAGAWYLAEGSASLKSLAAGPIGFETWVLVQNPGTTAANVTINYQTPSSDVAGPTFLLPANTRKSINIADTLPGEDSVATTVTATAPVVAVKSMYYWGLDDLNHPVKRISAHGAAGATAAQPTWWLPMGRITSALDGNFDTYILVQNPGATAVTAHVDFIGESTPGLITGYTLTLAPKTRQTVNVGKNVAGDPIFSLLTGQWFATIVSATGPVVVEKAVYDTQPGHITFSIQWMAGFGSLGTSSLGLNWSIPEGSTASAPQGSFTTFVGVVNPTLAPVNVGISYNTTGSVVAGPTLAMAPQSFRVVRVNDSVPNQWSVSTTVAAGGNVAAEGALYWDAHVTGTSTSAGNPGSRSITTCVGQSMD